MEFIDGFDPGSLFGAGDPTSDYLKVGWFSDPTSFMGGAPVFQGIGFGYLPFCSVIYHLRHFFSSPNKNDGVK